MSLRFRINLAITLVVVIFGIVTAYILVENMRNSINEEIEAGKSELDGDLRQIVREFPLDSLFDLLPPPHHSPRRHIRDLPRVSHAAATL